jgi:hypothetical protein
VGAGVPRWVRRTADPVTVVIAVATAAGLALRLFYLLHGGFLWSVTEYDDGPYFGSAVRLLEGALPYRDFVLVQPPGITLLMLPPALLAKVTGTAWGLASGRILTTLAGTAGVTLTGLLVRHRGVFATLVACGVMAVYPNAVAAAHTVLVEPWLVLFCLLGAALIFDGDGLSARPRRLGWGGVAFGFAGAVEAWAIVPAVVMMALCLTAGAPGRGRVRQAGRFAAGVAAGFLVPVTPFAAASPAGFYRSLVVAQIGPRSGAIRVGLLQRLYELAGLSDFRTDPASPRVPVNLLFIHGSVPLTGLIWGVTAFLVLATTGTTAFGVIVKGRTPASLEWFALAATWLVVSMFLWPSQFHYHFAAFLAPFLALALALPLANIASPPAPAQAPAPAGLPGGSAGPRRAARSRRLRAGVSALAATALTAFAAVQASAERTLYPAVPAGSIAQADRLIPPGSCLVSDNVTVLLLTGRFTPSRPGCTIIDDGLGTDLALSHGLTPQTGAGLNPAVAALWRESFSNAQFVWLTYRYRHRIAGRHALWHFLHQRFRVIFTDTYGDVLYRRDPRPAGGGRKSSSGKAAGPARGPAAQDPQQGAAGLPDLRVDQQLLGFGAHLGHLLPDPQPLGRGLLLLCPHPGGQPRARTRQPPVRGEPRMAAPGSRRLAAAHPRLTA